MNLLSLVRIQGEITGGEKKKEQEIVHMQACLKMIIGSSGVAFRCLLGSSCCSV